MEKKVTIPRNVCVIFFIVLSKATQTSKPGMRRRLRQEDPKFEASLGYTVRPSLKKNPAAADQTRNHFSLPPCYGCPKVKS